jgi:cob(I)alamin adenosyltransferase
MVKIYTRTGDAGETSLLGGRRVRKDDLRIECIGQIDETNAAIGIARVEAQRNDSLAELDETLALIQHRLFDLGAELASPDSAAAGANVLGDEDVSWIELAIDRWEARLAPLRVFILPGGSLAAAQLHLARCISRRAERTLVQLAAVEAVRGELVRYVNRLSDLLFVLARAANAASGVQDVNWEPKKNDEKTTL